MYKTIIGIDGMMCGMCESHIQDTIRKNFQVSKVTASHGKKTAEVIAEEPLEEAAVHAAIDPTGYTVLSVVSEPYEKKKRFGIFGK